MTTIAELAARKASLLAELSEINAEIASRAGEVDETGDDEPEVSRKMPAKAAEVVTATDKTADNATTATATP